MQHAAILGVQYSDGKDINNPYTGWLDVHIDFADASVGQFSWESILGILKFTGDLIVSEFAVEIDENFGAFETLCDGIDHLAGGGSEINSDGSSGVVISIPLGNFDLPAPVKDIMGAGV